MGVLLTCTRSCRTRCKRDQVNQTSCSWDNVKKVVKNGVTKIVSEVAWQDAKRIRSIRPLNPKINIKNGLKTRKMVIFYHLFYIFSGARGLLDLIPFASCQSTSCTSLEYPHGILWWNLKITIFGHPGPFRRWFLGVKPHFQSKMTKIKTVIWSKMANKTEVESVQLGNTYIADMDKCPRTNVAWTNVLVTVVICCICSQDPLFKVWSKSGQ